MAEHNQVAEDLIGFITRHMACPVCGGFYGLDDVRPVRHEGIQWALLATCPACGADQPITAFDCPPHHAQLCPPDPLVPSRVTQAELDEWTIFLAGFDGDLLDLLTST